MKKHIERYIFPRWSAEYKMLSFTSAMASFTGGISGPWLLHNKNALGVYAWHIGLVAMIVCLVLYVKGTYQKYMDYGWDVYY
jgi:hypothetical protein